MVDDFRQYQGAGIEQRRKHQRERNTHDESSKRAQRGHAPRCPAVTLLRGEKRFRIEWAKIPCVFCGFHWVHEGLRLAPRQSWSNYHVSSTQCGLRDTVLAAPFDIRIEFMRTLLSFLVLPFLVATAAMQSPSPTPVPSSSPQSSERPTLNRPGSPNAAPSPTPVYAPPPSSSSAAEAAQGNAQADYPKVSYPDLLPRFDYD